MSIVTMIRGSYYTIDILIPDQGRLYYWTDTIILLNHMPFFVVTWPLLLPISSWSPLPLNLDCFL